MVTREVLSPASQAAQRATGKPLPAHNTALACWQNRVCSAAWVQRKGMPLSPTGRVRSPEILAEHHPHLRVCRKGPCAFLRAFRRRARSGRKLQDLRVWGFAVGAPCHKVAGTRHSLVGSCSKPHCFSYLKRRGVISNLYHFLCDCLWDTSKGG